MLAAVGLFWFMDAILKTLTGSYPATQVAAMRGLAALPLVEYTALAWGVGLDWLLWRTGPDPITLVGGAIVIGSGRYLIRKEKIKDLAAAP